MKKNRPGWQLNVICMEEDREKLENIILGNNDHWDPQTEDG